MFIITDSGEVPSQEDWWVDVLNEGHLLCVIRRNTPLPRHLWSNVNLSASFRGHMLRRNRKLGHGCEKVKDDNETVAKETENESSGKGTQKARLIMGSIAVSICRRSGGLNVVACIIIDLRKLSFQRTTTTVENLVNQSPRFT